MYFGNNSTFEGSESYPKFVLLKIPVECVINMCPSIRFVVKESFNQETILNLYYKHGNFCSFFGQTFHVGVNFAV